MSIELSSADAKQEYIVGFEGEYTIDELQRMLDQLEGHTTVTRVELQLVSEQRTALRLPSGSSLGDDGIDTNPPPVETSARVQSDSVPFHILKVLVESDIPLRTEEIAEKLEELELSQNAIASRLWNLYQRGLVEKHPYPEDKRQKVYALTGRGMYAFESAKDRES